MKRENKVSFFSFSFLQLFRSGAWSQHYTVSSGSIHKRQSGRRLKRTITVLSTLLAVAFTASGQTTRYWVGGASASYIAATSWSSIGIGGAGDGAPVADDILIVDGSDISSVIGSQTGAVTITNVPIQALRRLTMQNSVDVTLTAVAASTLTLGRNVPPDGGIVIFTGSTLVIGTNVSITILDNADSQVDGTLQIVTGSTFNIGAAGGGIATINGIINNSGSITSTTGKLRFNSGSIYNHNRNGGTVPPATWNAGSTCLISGITNTAPTGLNQTFSNFTWNCPVQTSAVTLIIPGDVFTINGSLTITNTNGQILYLSDPGAFTLNTGGNLIINGATAVLDYCSGGGATSQTYNVTGNLQISAGAFYMGTEDRPYVFNLSGDFIMSGGTLTETGVASYTSNFNFVKTGTQVFNKTGGTISGLINFSVAGTSNLDMGTSVLTGDGNFTLNPAGTLTTANTAGIASSGATGSVQVTGARNFNTGANYVYNSSVADQITGSGLPATVNSLSISNTSGTKIVTLTSSTTVSSVLGLWSGVLSLGANNITLAIGAGLDGVAPSATNMVATGTGQFVKYFATGNTPAFTFPVGELTATAEYSPVTLDFSANATAGNIGVNVVDAIHPSINTGGSPSDYLSRYWRITAPALTTYTYNTSTYRYTAVDINGSEAAMKLSYWNTSAWTEISASSAAGNNLSISAPLTEVTGPLNGNDFTGRFLAVPALYYRSQASTAWNLTTTWETSVDGVTWLGTAALVTPTDANSSGIIIRAADNVTVSASVAADDFTVDGTLIISSVQTLTISDGAAATDMTVSTTGIVDNSGTIVATGAVSFNGNAVYNHLRDGGTIPTSTWSASSTCSIGTGFAGTTPSGLAQTFGNFRMNVAQTLLLSTDLTITNGLTLTAGYISSGNFNINYSGPDANITGASPASHIVTSGSGGFVRNITATGNYLFPLGDATNYTPITHNFTAGTFSSATLKGQVFAVKHPNNTSTQDFINRYWRMTPSGTFTAPSYTATFTFVAGDVNGTTANILGGLWDGTTWTLGSLPTGNSFSMTSSLMGTPAVPIDFTGTDGIPPTVITYNPADGALTVGTNDNLVLTFSEDVMVGTGGSITIYNSDASVFEDIPYNDARISFASNTVTINPAGTFTGNSSYYVQISNNAIRDLTGIYYAGISNNTTWNFTATLPYYRSKAAGPANWNNVATWEVSNDLLIWSNATVTPTDNNSNGITIQAGHTVTVSADVQADDITVDGTLTVNAGQTLTVANGAAATDMIVSTTGTVNNSGTITATGTISFNGNAVYNHTQNGGSVPAASWSSTSNLNITISANSAIIGLAQSFGNVAYTGGVNTLTLAQGPTVKGNLTINSGTIADGGNTITVNGNITNNGTHSGAGKIYLNGGSASHAISGGTSTFGNLELDDANGATFTGTGTTTITGNLTATQGTLTLNAFTTALAVNGTTSIGTGAASGAITMNSVTGTKTFTGLITIGANGTWTNPVNEAITLQGGITNNGLFTAGTGVHTFNTNAQALTGTFIIPGVTVTGITLTNNNSLTVNTALAGTGALTQAANASLNIGFTGAVGITTLNADAIGNTVTYNFSGAQTIKSPSVAYYHLITDVSGTKTLAAATTVNGNLSISAGTLADGGFVLQAKGNVINNGTHSGTGNITLTGGAAAHNISGTGSFQNIILNDVNGVVLGSNTAINGTLTLTSGVLQIGAFDLALNNTTAIAGGPFSLTKMIETSGTGRLIRSANATNASFNLTYPVGSGGYYSPFVVSGLTGAVAGVRSFSVRAVPSNPGVLTNRINRYWALSTTNITTGAGMVLSFQYNAGEIVGDPLLFQPYTNTSGSWAVATGPSALGSNPATSTGSATITGSWTVGSPSTFYSYQTGFWDQASTWTFDPGGTTGPGTMVPGDNDKVVILSGRTVSLQANNLTNGLDITINNGGFLDQTTFTFTNNIAALRGNGTLKLSSSNFPVATVNTFVTTDGGTTEYNHNGLMSATQAIYYHLTISSPGTVTQVSDITLNGDLAVKQGTFRINDATAQRLKLIINGNVTVDNTGSVAVGTGVTNSQVSPLGITGNTGSFLNYYELQSHRVQVYGNFTNNGTVKFSNLSFPVYDQLASNGFATVYFQGATDKTLTCNGITEFYNLVVDKGTDQTFKLTVQSSAYSNFRLFGANTSDGSNSLPAAPAANPNLKKALWIKNGTLVLQGLVVIPSLSEGATGGTYPSDFFIPSNGAFVLDGVGVIVLSTADDFSEVNAAYGLAGGSNAAYGINAAGGFSGLSNLGKLQVNNGYLSTRESSGLNYWSYASGQFIISNGKVDTKQFHNPEGGSTGLVSFTQNGGNLIVRGRFTNNISYTNPADLSNATINTARAANGIDPAAGIGAFSINNNAASGFSMSGGTLSVHDVCNTTATPLAFLVNCPASNINVTGGTLQIFPTTGTALADANYLVNSTAPVYNMIINRISGTSDVYLSINPLVVQKDLTIGSGLLNANNLNVTIGGNYTISAASTYTSGTNTTIFNGASNQTFSISSGAPLSLNNFTISTAAGIALNYSGSQTIVNVAGNFILVGGTMNDNGNTTNIGGNVFNSGVIAGTGKIFLNGTGLQTIDGNGIYNNVELNNTNAAAAPVSLLANMTVNGVLTFSNDKIFNINTFGLTLNSSASILGASSTRYLRTSGNSGDGGLTKVYSSPAAFNFPVGVVNYTSGSLGLSGVPGAYGSITVIPVNFAHPNVTAPGRSLTYFWRVKSSGFTLAPATLTHGYSYAQANVVTGGDVTEDEYVAARFDVPTSTWTKGVADDVDETNNIVGEPGAGVFLENVTFIDGDYTAGDDNPTSPFGVPTIYYSRINGALAGSGLWSNVNTWSLTGHTGAPAAAVPGAGDIVIIGGRDSVYLATDVSWPYTTANVDPRSCASLKIETGSALDIGYNPASSFGMVVNHTSGNGNFRLTTSSTDGSVYAFPSGDFSDFNVNRGTTEFYSTNPNIGPVFILSPTVTSYGTVILSPLGGSNIALPNTANVLIYGDLICRGQTWESWLAMSWSPAFYGVIQPKTVSVRGNLLIQGGSFIWAFNGATAQNIIIDGDVIVNPGAGIDVYSGTNNSMLIGGSLINNSDNSGPAIYGNFAGSNVRLVRAAAPAGVANVTFFGTNNGSITNNPAISANPNTTFNNVTINKGTSQATTLTINIGGVLATPVDNWLTLQNGTLRYMRTNPGTNFTISQGTPFNIPATTGLHVDYANGSARNILIGDINNTTGDLLLSGKITLINGNVYVGPVASPAFANDIEYTTSGASAIDVQGGTLVVNGQIRRNTSGAAGILKYLQSGGTVRINGQAANNTNAKLEVVNDGSDFTMSAGTLTIVRGNGATTTPSSPFGDLYIRPQTGSVTGGIIEFAHTGINAPHNYFIEANIPLYNVMITGLTPANYSTVRILTSPLTINGDMTISSNTGVLNANNINVTFNGNLINTAPASVGYYITGTNLTTFSASVGSSYIGAQSITGTTNFYDLNVTPGVSLTLNNPIDIDRNLTISTGTLVMGANPVTVQGNVANAGSYTDDNSLGSGLILNGTAQQQISGTGAFARLTLNNAAGARTENNISLQEDLTMTLGILDIKKYLLTLGTNSNIQGPPFGATKMITSDGVFSNVGLRKFFNPGATTFLYPIGTSGKYTPGLLTVTASNTVGYIRINNISSRHPAVLDPANSLNYYWEVQSSGITGFTGDLVLTYMQSDVAGDEPNYRAAKIAVPGTTWTLGGLVNDVANTIPNSFTLSNNLSGEYTAGITSAFFTSVPTYTTNSNGFWDDETIWSQTAGDLYPCPPDGPNGFIVNINHAVTIQTNFCSAYRATINNELRVAEPYYGHNFGTVYGNGILHLERGTFPAGVYTSFLSCTGNGTVDYGGTGTYTIIADLYDNIPNLKFTGSGTRVLPNKDLTICNTLTIDGPVVDNSVYNKKLTIQGSMRRISGTFKSGSGAGAVVSFAGTAPQTAGGAAMGDFTGTSAFNNLEINNSSGLRINDAGAVDVAGNLLLTNGLINTGAGRILTITNSAINSVIPSGGSTVSFVDGPLVKRISQYDYFLFPIGIYKAGPGNILGNRLTISSTQTGPLLWTAKYENPNPTSNNLTAPLQGVSAQEYFTIKTTPGSQAVVNLDWTPSTDVNPVTAGGMSNIRVANYSAGTSWVEIPTTSSGNNNNGTASTSSVVTFTASDDYALGTITPLIPRAQFTPSGPVCGNDGIPVTFSAPGAIPFDYILYYTINGAAQAPKVISGTPYVLPTLVPGTYRLSAFQYNSGADNGVVDATPVNVYATPTTSNAGTDQTLCGVLTTNLAGNTPAVGTGLWSTVSGTGGTIISPTSPTSQFIGLNGSSYTLRWTISSGTCLSTDDVVINFTILPDAPAAVSPQNFCGPATVANLVASPPVGCTVDWYIASTGGSPLAGGTALINGNTYWAESNGGGGCLSMSRTPVLVNINPVPVPGIAGNNSVCIGSTGNPYSTEAGMSNYTWSIIGGFFTGGLGTNSVTVTWNVVGPQTISVNYQNAFGCSAASPTIYNVTVNDYPTITLGINPSVCSGTTTANLTYSATTGSPNSYSIDYNVAAETAGFGDITNIVLPASPIVLFVPGAAPSGTYQGTLTVRNTVTGCVSGNYLITITVNPLPQGSLTANGPFCATGAGQLTWTATAGTGPYTVIYNDGTADRTANAVVSGTPFAVFTTPVTSTTTYTLVSVTDAGACVRSSGFTGGVATITVNPSLPVSVIVAADANPVCTGTTVTYTATPTNGGTTPAYQWVVNASNVGTNSTTYSYVPVNGDVVSVVLTSSESCQSGSPATSNTVTMVVNTAPSVTSAQTDVLCKGASTGAIDITVAGGTTPYTYAWTGTGVAAAAEDQTGLAAGSYSVIVTDAGSCSSAPLSVTITEPAVALSGSITSQTNVSVFGGSNGSITVAGSGGTSPYQYSLNGGAYQASGTSGSLIAGNYTVTVRDANLCTFDVSVTITQPAAALSGSITSQTNVACFGTSTGSVTVAGSGGLTPYEYSLDAGAYQLSGTFGSLAVGSYTVTIRDASLITFNVSITITQPALALGGMITGQTNVLCLGNNTGNITVAGSGGTAPYQYKLGTGSYQSSGSFGTLTAGAYTITVQDANLCIFNVTATITQPAASLSGSILLQANVSCKGGANGNVSIGGAGGTPPYEYNISGGTFQTSGVFASLAAGSYTVTVRDANLCTANVSVTITEPAVLAINHTPVSASCPDTPDGSISLTITGGTQPYNVIWSDGITTINRTNIPDGSYNVIVTDANDCAASLDIELDNTGSVDCVVAQEVITPNNDGFNDTWKIRNIDLFPDAEVLVYNRWGKLIFKTKNISDNEWDGTSDGKPLPTDSYHYILYLNDGSKPRSGVISIIR